MGLTTGRTIFCNIDALREIAADTVNKLLGGIVKEMTTEELIRHLALVRHPEGGWYRETYRSNERVPSKALPARFGGERSFCTAIYFLLEQGDVSALHRIKSDEIWHYYAGASLSIHVLTRKGDHEILRLGPDITAGETFQTVVPGECWFGAEVSGSGPYSLVGCTVAPGFDFADFEMGTATRLLQTYPAHDEIIRRLTRTSG
jgi:predicted cupin superfamily sugar epimerase